MGVEVDEWQRPVAYWLYPRHPATTRSPRRRRATLAARAGRRDHAHRAVRPADADARRAVAAQRAGQAAAHGRLRGGRDRARAQASASIMGFIQSPEIDDRRAGRTADDDPMSPTTWWTARRCSTFARHHQGAGARREVQRLRAEQRERRARAVHALHAAQRRRRHGHQLRERSRATTARATTAARAWRSPRTAITGASCRPG
jgi:hypothetical protein